MTRIAIIGTHGVGKTTLSYILAAQYKMTGSSVKIVQEVARSCPYPLNEGMTLDSCLWIYHEHIKKEMDAILKHQVVICDRSALDSFLYAQAQGCVTEDDPLFKHSFEAAKAWMKTYTKIIYVISSNEEIEADGVRSTDVSFQRRVERKFDEWVLPRKSQLPIFFVTSKEIFEHSGPIQKIAPDLKLS